MSEELIVLCDETGRPTGTAEKLSTHHAATPLHLAFSCYLFNNTGELLLTQRAATKKVWPGVWTASVCGHPMPGESLLAALQRRADYELGITAISRLGEILPDYRYRTPPFNGIIENEFCPVFAGRLASSLQLNPKEVEAYRWVTWSSLKQEIAKQPEIFSYWLKEQLPLLEVHPDFAEYRNAE